MTESASQELEDQPNPFMHMIAPIAAVGATLIMRKVLTSAYERRTGHDFPDPRDPAVSFTRALGWAVAIAATAAAVETVVFRVTNRAGSR